MLYDMYGRELKVGKFVHYQKTKGQFVIGYIAEIDEKKITYIELGNSHRTIDCDSTFWNPSLCTMQLSKSRSSIITEDFELENAFDPNTGSLCFITDKVSDNKVLIDRNRVNSPWRQEAYTKVLKYVQRSIAKGKCVLCN